MNSMCSYCPTCSAVLDSMSVMDIYASAYSCANDHRFLHYEKEVLSQESERAGLLDSLIDSTDGDLSVIEYWLTNENARSHLNGQLAEIIQNIYWSCEAGNHLRPKGNSFLKCPLCRGSLETFEQDDVWFQGKKCRKGHEFYERGGRLNYTVNGESTHLVSEMSEEVLVSLREGWLKNNPLLEPQLHPQIRSVLEHYEV